MKKTVVYILIVFFFLIPLIVSCSNSLEETSKVTESKETSMIMNLPDKLYACVGLETNVYFDNISDNWEQYDWDVNGPVGIQLERGYRVVPTASDVGEHIIRFKASLDDNTFIFKSVSLEVSDIHSTSENSISIIVLGDSTTANGTVIEYLHHNFINSSVTIKTLGTCGVYPNNHEGRSGWTLEEYFTIDQETYSDDRGTVYNPFYNPATKTFDASYYFTNSGVDKPDWFIINMGINDMFPYDSDSDASNAIQTFIDRLETMAASIRKASSDIKIAICLTIPPNASQDAFGKQYNLWITRNRYKRNNLLLVSALIESFGNRQDISLVPIHASLDTVYNMGIETIPVNARNLEFTYNSPTANGGVHPAESGYWQIADVYTAFLLAAEQ